MLQGCISNLEKKKEKNKSKATHTKITAFQIPFLICQLKYIKCITKYTIDII